MLWPGMLQRDIGGGGYLLRGIWCRVRVDWQEMEIVTISDDMTIVLLGR